MTTPADRRNDGEPEALDFGPIHDFFAQQCVQNFKTAGTVYSNIYFLELARPIKRQPMPRAAQPMDPRLTHEFMATPAGRGRLTAFLRDALTAGTPVRASLRQTLGFEPDVIVHVDEAWETQAATMEEAQAVRPSAHPQRREVVMISIHHRWGGTIVNTLPIIELPQRHVKFRKLPDGLIATIGPMAMTPDTRA